VLLGCDLVVSASSESLARLYPGRSRAFINSYETATADFIHNKDYQFPGAALKQAIATETGDSGSEFVDATRIARDLLGDTIASNLFLLGFAYQRGLIPVSADAINQAVELNGVAIELNQAAFLWGRRAAVNLDAVMNQIGDEHLPAQPLTKAEDIINWRYDFLVQYQNAQWAEKYLAVVNKVKAAEPGAMPGDLTIAVAKSLFKLMSYKDEYEVARLYSDGQFMQKLEEQFEGPMKINFHLAPPLLAKINSFSGLPEKRILPGFTMSIFKFLATLKGLRGGRIDLFGRGEERKQERALIAEYNDLIDWLIPKIDADNYQRAVELVSLADIVKGFGHIKLQNIEHYRSKLDLLKRRFDSPELSVVVNG
jgi:indolepyruvate ferredoxin oxidoreductase